MFSIKLIAIAAVLFGATIVCSCHERTRTDPSGGRARTDSTCVIRVYSEGSQGFGYALYQGGRKIIDQPNIPAVQHLAPFLSREEAESVAQLVNGKLQSHQFPPSVTIHELDSLRIRY